MAYIKKEWKIYSVDELKEIAKNCTSKEEFRLKHKEEYSFCVRKKLNKEILSLIPHKTKWTKEALISDAKKYVKISDWMNANISAYNTALKKDFYEECVSHMTRLTFGPNIKWDYDKIKEVYVKYTNIMDLRLNDGAAYNTAMRYGWHKELSKDMKRGWDNKRNVKWTFENTKKEALKYNSIKELQTKSSSAYNAAIRKKWLMDIIGHMDGGYTKWTLEKLVNVLSQYPKNKWSTAKECKTAYVYIKRHKIEDKVLELLNKK
jgi:hypothetical protein